MVLDDQELSKIISVERAMFLFKNQDGYDFDDTWSVLADLLNAAMDFNLIDEICNMVIRGQSYPADKCTYNVRTSPYIRIWYG